MKGGASVKDKETRAREAAAIRRQLADLKIPDAALAEVDAALDSFRDEGYGVTATYKLRDLGCAVALQLSTRAHTTSFARVRFEKFKKLVPVHPPG